MKRKRSQKNLLWSDVDKILTTDDEEFVRFAKKLRLGAKEKVFQTLGRKDDLLFEIVVYVITSKYIYDIGLTLEDTKSLILQEFINQNFSLEEWTEMEKNILDKVKWNLTLFDENFTQGQ